MGEILEFIKRASEGKPYQPNGLEETAHTYLGKPWGCSTCEYGPTRECGWNSACNNCIDGSNYWRKSDG